MATLAWIALAVYLIYRLSNKKPRYNPADYLKPAPDAQPAYVVFDVETTGLPPDRFPTTAEDVERWEFPHIVSMAWLVLSEDFQLIKSDLLFIDDFGIQRLEEPQRLDLMEIVEDRHGLKSTLIAGQMPVAHWHEIIGEATLADAILDRLIHSAHRVQLAGKSLRKNTNKNN